MTPEGASVVTSTPVGPSLRSYSDAIGRWARFGPYYAMFPVSFVFRAVQAYCEPGDAVIDPFCGRGTVPFIAKITGRTAMGVDINPVAYVFAMTKIDPEPNHRRLLERICDIEAAVTAHDCEAENEFQAWAWSPEVLGFLRAARRLLKWKTNRCDRTLMGVMLVHVHGKLGNAVSNQMRQSKSMAPDYSVRWWRQRGMRPPQISPAAYFGERIRWRYEYGTVGGAEAIVRMGDAASVLQRLGGQFQLLLTSPPYCGVTDYRLDNWIRLWMLGGPSLPDYDTSQRFCDRGAYQHLLAAVFGAARGCLANDGVVYVRTDSREFTRYATVYTLRKLWPHYSWFWHSERHSKSQTDLFGGAVAKPGETDILGTTRDDLVPREFCEIPRDLDEPSALVR